MKKVQQAVQTSPDFHIEFLQKAENLNNLSRTLFRVLPL